VFARVILEQFAQLSPTAMQPRRYRADRTAHDLGDLLVGEAFDVGEINNQPVLRWHRLECLRDGRFGQAVEYLGLSRVDQRRSNGVAPGDPPALDFLGGGNSRLTLSRAVGVDEGGRQDAVEPGPEVRIRTEPVE
jgi:hypothetical protein